MAKGQAQFANAPRQPIDVLAHVSRKRPPKRLAMAIAERTGTLILRDGTHRKVRVRLEKPRKTRGFDDYSCRYQITGLADDSVRRGVFGLDSVQAIELALRFIGAQIELETPAGATWEASWENLGFPLFKVTPSGKGE